MRLELAFVVFALAAESALAIGRVGNSRYIGDPVEKFVVPLPAEFGDVSVHAGGAVLESGLFTSSPPMPVEVQLAPFRSEYPLLVGKDLSEIEKFFGAAKETSYRSAGGASDALSLFGESSLSVVGVSICSDGRGYVAFAPKLAITKRGILQLLERTVFDPPCKK